MRICKSLVIGFLALMHMQTQAQLPAIDSILKKVTAAATDQERLTIIMELIEFRNSLHADTAKKYFTNAKQIAQKTGNKKTLRWIEYSLLSGELTKGNTDSIVIKIETQPLFRFNKQEDPELYYKLQLLKANALNRMNDRTKALDLQLKLLQEAENESNILAQSYLLNYIGATYINSGNYAAAKHSWQQALQLIQKNPREKLKEIETVIYSNLVLYYGAKTDSTLNRQMTDSFLLYTNKTIDQSRQYNIYWLLPAALSYRGNYYGVVGKTAEGEADFKEAIYIRSKIGDPLYVAGDYINLASFFLWQKKYDSTIHLLKQTLTIIKEGHINELNTKVLSILSYAYKQKGDYKAYSQALEQFVLDADTANLLNAADKIAGISMKYDVQKKEATIARQKLQLAQRLNYVIAILLLAAIAFTIFYFYVRNYKKEQKVKRETAILEAEILERKRIAAELHDNMGVLANAVLHNSNQLFFAETEKQIIATNLQQNAKDILSTLRETVWALKANEVSYTETWLRIVNFINQTKRDFTTIAFETQGSTADSLQMPSVKALHIIMVVKEVITNAVKHASATAITITSGITAEDHWIISINDNGIGFDINKMINTTEHNGLIHMKERATIGNFKVNIQSQSNEGTSVFIEI